jgi:hypothetical protein
VRPLEAKPRFRRYRYTSRARKEPVRRSSGSARVTFNRSVAQVNLCSAAQIAVPEEALFVKESSAKPKSFLPGGFEVRTVNGGARQQGPAVARGGQGRAEPARRGSLDRSRLFSCRQPPSRKTAVRRSWLLGGGQTQRTSPLPLFGRAGLRFGCRPFLRVRHMVCFGHSQVGSFKYSASPNAGGPRRSSSSRPGCVRTSQPAASARQRISPSRRP